MVGGGVPGKNAETAQRCASLDRRRRRRSVPDVNHVSHIVRGVHMAACNVPPPTASRPRRKHAL